VNPAPETERARPAGLRLIVAYKLVKAAVALGVAAWILLAPEAALQVASTVASDLSEHGATLTRVGRWLGMHLTARNEHGAALLAALDGVASLVEGLLLSSGRAWGEWLVLASLAALVPLEVAALVHRPSAARAGILLVNLLVVAYLARLLLGARADRAEA